MYSFWKIFIDTYCDGDNEKVDNLNARLEPYANFMYLTVAMAHPLMPKEYKSVYADKVRNSILSRYDELVKFNWEI